jgi:hypothetical protein
MVQRFVELTFDGHLASQRWISVSPHTTQHPPPKATTHSAYLEDLDRQVAAAHLDGAFTAVLRLAEGHHDRLAIEMARALDEHDLPFIDRLRWELRQWDYVAAHAREFAANEAHGWTVKADGSYAKTMDDGRKLSCTTTVVPHEDRRRSVRTRLRPAQRRTRERRPGAIRRASSSSSTSSADPGGDSDPEPAEPEQLVLADVELGARLAKLATSLRSKGGLG